MPIEVRPTDLPAEELQQLTNQLGERQASWPDNPQSGDTLVIGAGSQNLFADNVVLPDNFIIKFAPEVTKVNWRFNRFSFGENCTIDLSATQEQPSKPSKAAGGGGQPSWGQTGSGGGGGTAGTPGKAGVELNLNVGQVDGRGSLWIKADGGPGGDGGDGGDGGLGGGWSCGRQGEPWTNGGQGGNGGPGGPGGQGGDTAKVTLTVVNFQSLAQVQFSDQWPSIRPDIATGNDGRIAVWGASGPGGLSGQGGAGGPGGDGPPSRRKDCGVFTPDVHGGPYGGYGSTHGRAPSGNRIG